LNILLFKKNEPSPSDSEVKAGSPSGVELEQPVEKITETPQHDEPEQSIKSDESVEKSVSVEPVENSSQKPAPLNLAECQNVANEGVEQPTPRSKHELAAYYGFNEDQIGGKLVLI
jgi:hypothetical protein